MKSRIMVAASAAIAFALTPVIAQQTDEPVHFSELVTILPDDANLPGDAEGFSVGKPEGSTADAMGFKITSVSRAYYSGSMKVTIKIADSAGNPLLAAAEAISPEFNAETTEGYSRGFMLDGYKAIENYETAKKTGSLAVFADGFLVEIQTEGMESSAMQQWWKQIDTKKLKKLRD